MIWTLDLNGTRYLIKYFNGRYLYWVNPDRTPHKGLGHFEQKPLTLPKEEKPCKSIDASHSKYLQTKVPYSLFLTSVRLKRTVDILLALLIAYQIHGSEPFFTTLIMLTPIMAPTSGGLEAAGCISIYH